jgi:AraC family carnitine catabolism transcriptional activator
MVLAPLGSLSSALLALEPLRAVNRFLGAPIWEFAFVGATREPIATGVGISVEPAASFDEDPACDLVVVAATQDQPPEWRRPLMRWLRRRAHDGSALCGIDFGPIFLAEAGLLRGRRATAHWEVLPAATERFPDVEFREEIYVVDGDRLTCGGHLSCHDLFLALVEAEHGVEVARFVEADLVSAPRRPAAARQGDPLTSGPPVADPRLRRVVDRMRANLEQPMTLAQLSREAGVSPRRLQALAREGLGEPISRRYLALRLAAARNMLMYSDMSVTEIAVATGFGSGASFSRAFRDRFKDAPMRYRKAFRSARVRPYFFPAEVD